MYILNEEHQERAIEIATQNRKRKSCKHCYDRGYVGYTPEKMIVVCTKCVDLEKSHKGWQDYVEANPELKKELIENDLYTEEETDKAEAENGGDEDV